MEKKEEYVHRENKRQFFDKRLIKEIVKSVEAGMPRKDAVGLHGMSPVTLREWMRKYGSTEYHVNKRKVYTPSQKRSVVRAVESGMSVREAQISFGIKGGRTIGAWLREAKQENTDLSLGNFPAPMAKQPQNEESDEVKALKKALADAELKVKALDTLIDIAEEQLKVDIRKKSGARQSPK